MNVRLDYETSFSAIIINSDKIYPNVFHCRLALVTNCEDNDIQNVAFNRVKFLIDDVFHDSIILNKDSAHLSFFQKLMPHKIVTLPLDPYDQIMGLALFLKLNSIMDDEIILIELAISSDAGDGLWYTIDLEDDFDLFTKNMDANKPYWYVREDIQTNENKHAIKLSWDDLQLSWEQIEQDNFEIDFTPDPELLTGAVQEVAPVQAPEKTSKKKKVFNPTIIAGGQDPDESK